MFQKLSSGLNVNSPKTLIVFLRVLRVLVAEEQTHVDAAVQSDVTQQLVVLLSKPKSITKAAGDEAVVLALACFALVLGQSAEACVIVGEDKNAAADNMVKGLNWLMERGTLAVPVANPRDPESPLQMSIPVAAARVLAALAEAHRKFSPAEGSAGSESKDDTPTSARQPTSSRGKKGTPTASMAKPAGKQAADLLRTSNMVLSGFDLSLDMVAQPDLNIRHAEALTRVIKAVTNLPNGLESVMGKMVDIATARSTARMKESQGTARSAAGSEAGNTARGGARTVGSVTECNAYVVAVEIVLSSVVVIDTVLD